MRERKPGYYWVRWNHFATNKIGEWEVAYYRDKQWLLVGDDNPAQEHNLAEIDERRIERPADPERVWYEHGEKK